MKHNLYKIFLFILGLQTGTVTASNNVTELSLTQGKKLLTRYVKQTLQNTYPKSASP